MSLWFGRCVGKWVFRSLTRFLCPSCMRTEMPRTKTSGSISSSSWPGKQTEVMDLELTVLNIPTTIERAKILCAILNAALVPP